MADRVRFGPAGNPLDFKGPTVEAPIYVKEEGLDAYEYQAVRGVRIKEDAAKELGKNAEENDVYVSLHGPYYINLASDKKDTFKKSKERLLESMRAAMWMGARKVVFHPGYYGEKTPGEALKMCIEALKEVVEKAKAEGLKGVLLAPETTGKISQLGSLDEILTMCEEVELVCPTIDWAHIHAREQGLIKGRKEYEKILNEIEKRLGSEVLKDLHCHFTKVEFTDKGEKTHRLLSEKEFGPPFEPLAELIVEWDLKPVIISESPTLDRDAINMKKIYERLRKRKTKKRVTTKKKRKR